MPSEYLLAIVYWVSAASSPPALEPEETLGQTCLEETDTPFPVTSGPYPQQLAFPSLVLILSALAPRPKVSPGAFAICASWAGRRQLHPLGGIPG